MSDKGYVQLPWEPERYELTAGAPYRFDLDRREFFKFLGAGLLVVSVLKPAVGRARVGRGETAAAAILYPKRLMRGCILAKTVK